MVVVVHPRKTWEHSKPAAEKHSIEIHVLIHNSATAALKQYLAPIKMAALVPQKIIAIVSQTPKVQKHMAQRELHYD